MKKKTVITIGREYGSGGRLIGEKLAKLLDIPFYDKDLIKLAAKKTGYAEEVFAQVDEKPINSLLYSIGTGNFMLDASMSMISQVPVHDKLFVAQCEIIRNLANEQSCVIVGRCADYILKDNPNLISIFICASKEERIRRVKEFYHLEVDNVESYIQKMDKKRASYYNHYTDYHWGKASNYDLTLNTSIGIDACVKLIGKYIAIKNQMENANQ